MSRNVEDWIEGYLAYTENTEPRETYRRWIAISTLASVLQRKCWLQWGTEIFYPNMYIVLVGPPAARKGTAMRPGKGFLQRLGLAVSADESSRQKLIRSLTDAQAIVELEDGGKMHHCSLTVISTELTVFLGYEDKEFLTMFCKLYDCEDTYVYDTFQRGREEVPNVWVNMQGATTPAQLQAAVPEGFIGSGFTSRVIFVFEEDKEKIVIKPDLSPEQLKLEEALQEDLTKIHTIAGPFQTTPEFDKLYTEWRMSSEETQPFSDPRLEYYLQRRPTHLFKLSMIISASRNSQRIITGDHLHTAIKNLEEVESKMPQVFSGLGSNPLAGVQAKLKRMLRTEKEVSMKDIAKRMESDASHTQLSEAIRSLEQMGLVSLELTKRPPTLVYLGD